MLARLRHNNRSANKTARTVAATTPPILVPEATGEGTSSLPAGSSGPPYFEYRALQPQAIPTGASRLSTPKSAFCSSMVAGHVSFALMFAGLNHNLQKILRHAKLGSFPLPGEGPGGLETALHVQRRAEPDRETGLFVARVLPGVDDTRWNDAKLARLSVNPSAATTPSSVPDNISVRSSWRGWTCPATVHPG